MDHRDRLLNKHHQQRLSLSGRVPAHRLLRDACLLKARAQAQHRFQLYILAALWEHDLEVELSARPCGEGESNPSVNSH